MGAGRSGGGGSIGGATSKERGGGPWGEGCNGGWGRRGRGHGRCDLPHSPIWTEREMHMNRKENVHAHKPRDQTVERICTSLKHWKVRQEKSSGRCKGFLHVASLKWAVGKLHGPSSVLLDWGLILNGPPLRGLDRPFCRDPQLDRRNLWAPYQLIGDMKDPTPFSAPQQLRHQWPHCCATRRRLSCPARGLWFW
jgi:hypothetical protein